MSVPADNRLPLETESDDGCSGSVVPAEGGGLLPDPRGRELRPRAITKETEMISQAKDRLAGRPGPWRKEDFDSFAKRLQDELRSQSETDR